MLIRKRSIFVYAWDLFDEGIAAALDRIVGLGMTGIVVSAAYHSGKFYLPHNPQKRVYYHSDASVYFTPDLVKYGKLKPQTGDAYERFRTRYGQSEDLFSAICTEAKKRRLEVVAWVVGFHNSLFGSRYPDNTVQNAFGDRYRHALCPAHEENRQYAMSLIEDLTYGYEIDGILVEAFDYLGMLHGDHHEIIGVSHTKELEELLGLCFCPVCTERASRMGIDVEQLVSDVRQAVDLISRSNKPVDPFEIPGYERYLDFRSEIVEEVFRSAREAVSRSNDSVQLLSTYWQDKYSNPTLYGVVPNRISCYLDGWVVCYPASAEEVHAYAAKARRTIPEHQLAVGVSLIGPQVAEPGNMSRYLQAFEQSDVEQLYFYNYGLASDVVLKELGQSLALKTNKK